MSVPSATLRSMMNCEMTPLGPAGSDHWISIMAGVRTSSCGAAMPSGTGDGGKFVPQTASMQYKYYMYVCVVIIITLYTALKLCTCFIVMCLCCIMAILFIVFFTSTCFILL